jgi:hypothetical protein
MNGLRRNKDVTGQNRTNQNSLFNADKNDSMEDTNQEEVWCDNKENQEAAPNMNCSVARQRRNWGSHTQNRENRVKPHSQTNFVCHSEHSNRENSMCSRNTLQPESLFASKSTDGALNWSGSDSDLLIVDNTDPLDKYSDSSPDEATDSVQKQDCFSPLSRTVYCKKSKNLLNAEQEMKQFLFGSTCQFPVCTEESRTLYNDNESTGVSKYCPSQVRKQSAANDLPEREHFENQQTTKVLNNQ